MTPKQLIETIETARDAKGWTDYQLAKESGVPHSIVSRYIRGERSVTAPTLLKMLKALGLTVTARGRK